MKQLLFRIQRMCYLIIVAWLLGVSNVILEETQIARESRNVIEQQEIAPETDYDEDEVYKVNC